MSEEFNSQLPSGEQSTISQATPQDTRPTMAERHQSVPVPPRSRPESLMPVSRPHSIMSTGSAGSRDRHTLVRLWFHSPLFFLFRTTLQMTSDFYLTLF